MSDLSPHQDRNSTHPNISLPGAVSRTGLAAYQKQLDSQTGFSSDSIPSTLLWTQDGYIEVWRLRLLALNQTPAPQHSLESLSHCLRVLRASAGSNGWQGLCDLAQILHFITPVTLLECFKIRGKNCQVSSPGYSKQKAENTTRNTAQR